MSAPTTCRIGPAATGGFRTLIPSSFASRIAGLEADLVVNDELLAKQQSNLETQNKLITAAREQREDRIAELHGGGKANPAPPGLVAEITEADDQRNASLVEVDRLRREISAAQKNVGRLIRENNDLAHTLQSRLAPKLTALSSPSLAAQNCERARSSNRAAGVSRLRAPSVQSIVSQPVHPGRSGFALFRRSGKPYHP